MIKTVHGELVATCNNCGEERFGGCQESFRAFVAELKSDGWKVAKNEDGEWEHHCPECAEIGR